MHAQSRVSVAAKFSTVPVAAVATKLEAGFYS